MTNLGAVPKQYPEVYEGFVEGYQYIYNPLATCGLVVLNQASQNFYKLVDGIRTVGEIHQITVQNDPALTQQDVLDTINQLYESDIVYFDQPKSPKKVFKSNPTHLGVWMHITNQCNLRCKYCYVYKTQEKMSWEVAETATKNIFRDAKEHGFNQITFKFSGGEALLELPTILKVADLAKQLAEETAIKTDFVVLSNGVLITDATAQTLKANDFRASVSLDGLGEYHDSQRVFANGMGSFKYVVAGLENLLKHKVPFNVSVTVTNKNAKNLPELTKYLLAKDVSFALNFYRENPNVSEELYGNEKEMIDCIRHAYSIIYDNVPQNSLLAGILDRVNIVHPHRHPCGVGNSYIVVRHNGDMASCQMTLEKPIGTIFEGDLIETMENNCFIEPKGLTVESKTPCNTCIWRYICCGGCPLLTFEQKGSYTSNSPYCSIYRKLIPEVLKLEAKRLMKYGMGGIE